MDYESWDKLLSIVTGVLGALASALTIAEKIKSLFPRKKKKAKRKNRKK